MCTKSSCFWISIAIARATVSGAGAQVRRIRAREVGAEIQKQVGVDWQKDTVDTFKAGNPDIAGSLYRRSNRFLDGKRKEMRRSGTRGVLAQRMFDSKQPAPTDDENKRPHVNDLGRFQAPISSRGWRNWQTQRTQNPPTFGSWGFDSPSRHQHKNPQNT